MNTFFLILSIHIICGEKLLSVPGPADLIALKYFWHIKFFY
jgi:hypothetical protein